MHAHTRLTALCPGLPGWAGTRKVKPIWILLKQETVSGSGISWTVCMSASRSSFLQAGCTSWRPTNRVKALKASSLWNMTGYACFPSGISSIEDSGTKHKIISDLFTLVACQEYCITATVVVYTDCLARGGQDHPQTLYTSRWQQSKRSSSEMYQYLPGATVRVPDGDAATYYMYMARQWAWAGQRPRPRFTVLPWWAVTGRAGVFAYMKRDPQKIVGRSGSWVGALNWNTLGLQSACPPQLLLCNGSLLWHLSRVSK